MKNHSKRSTLIRLGALLGLPWAGPPRTGLAQTEKKPLRIGLIALGTAEMRGPWEQSLIEGLRQRGYVEGRNLVLERRHADGRTERMPQIADELAALKLDVIVTTCTPSTRLMHKATRTTPLVMAAVSDPVGQGLIASYRRPGGNITGLASQFEEVAAKMLELLQAAVPKASPVAVFFKSTNPVHKSFLREMETAAGRLKIRLLPVEITLRTDIRAAFDGMARQGVASVLVLPDDPSLTHLRRRIIEMTVKHRLPSFFGVREAVEDGGLMSYGESMSQSYFRAASYVDKIVKGANPAELPVERPTRFELVISQKTAKALGLTIPQSLLLRADRVIE